MEFVVHVSNRVLKKGEQFFERTIKKSKMINQFGFFKKQQIPEFLMPIQICALMALRSKD